MLLAKKDSGLESGTDNNYGKVVSNHGTVTCNLAAVANQYYKLPMPKGAKHEGACELIRDF